MRRLQILRGQLQYKPELKDGEFFLDKTNHSLLIGDAAVADGQFELAKQSAITNLQQQVDTKITAAQAPVQSVNTKTGAVVLTAADVGALPDTTSIPTKTSELTNDSNFVDTTTLNSSLDTKQNTITGGASTITDDNLTTNRALVSNSSGKVAVSTVTATELGYLDGVTSNIQTQIDGLDDSVLLGAVEGEDIFFPSSQQWTGSIYANNKFILFSGNTIALSNIFVYSLDGINWISSTMPSSSVWANAAYGNDKIVVYSRDDGNGSYSSSKIAYSTDGINWTESTLPVSSEWNSITYGNGKFVIVGNKSNIVYSSDGINWTSLKLSELSYNIRAVTYGDGKFVAIGGDINNAIVAYSNDGVTWNLSNISQDFTTLNYNSICYGNGRFVAIAQDGAVVYTEDGILWSKYDTSLDSSKSWIKIIYDGEKFLVSGTGTIAYSTTGDSWDMVSLQNSSAVYNIVYGDKKYVSYSAGSRRVFYSTDGITWINKSPSSYTLNSTTGTDITSSVYSALEPYIPAPTVPTKTSELTNDSGYITQSDGDGRYLQLTGGVVDGTVWITKPLEVQGLTPQIKFNTYTYVRSNSAGTSMDIVSNSAYVVRYDKTNGTRVYGLSTPVSDDMATPKSYVDQYAPHATLVTLTVAGWNSTAKTQTVTVSGILADESKQLIIAMPATASMTAYSDAGIQCTGQAANSLTFTAETVPTAAISVYVTYQTVIS